MQDSENSEGLQNLQKQNNNLMEQAQKYALMLSEEKAEKKEVWQRYDKLEEKHEQLSLDFQEKQQVWSNQKLKLALFISLTG